MATFASLTNYKLLDNEAEDSYNILPLLTNEVEPEVIREAIVHHSGSGYFAIRKGNWKLLLANHSGGWSEPNIQHPLKGPYQLFDLDKDPEETTNLYKSNPKKVEELRQLMIKYLNDGRSTKGKPQKNEEIDLNNYYLKKYVKTTKWHQLSPWYE